MITKSYKRRDENVQIMKDTWFNIVADIFRPPSRSQHESRDSGVFQKSTFIPSKRVPTYT